MQCRVTTEDPENKFMPDYGRIIAYRSPGGFGVRLDGGMGYAGAVITPFYDSLLVKSVTSGQSYEIALNRARRTLSELPRAVNFISGPSRTGDIEQKMVLGVHGPYRVHIVLVG